MLFRSNSKAAAGRTKRKAPAPSSNSKAPALPTKRKAAAPKVICRSYIELSSICHLHFSDCVCVFTSLSISDSG